MNYSDWKKVYIDQKISLREWQNQRDSGKILPRFDIQRFSSQKLPAGNYNLNVRQQVQNKHIEGTKECRDYAARLVEKGRKPSLLSPEIDVEAFVKAFHGKGVYTPSGDGSHREVVDAGEIVGKYWNNRTNSYEETTFVKIIYSKKGVHIFPVFPGSKED